MKKIVLLPLAAILLFFGAAPAQAIPLTNTDNKHNLSSNATPSSRIQADLPAAGGTDEICVFCHTPHGASAQSPLWNRKDPGDMGSFTLYNSGTLVIGSGQAQTDAEYGPSFADGYPNGASRMCMSCHDGNTANFGEVVNAPNATGSGSSIAMTSGTWGTADLGNLSDVHPISFIYNDPVLNGPNGILSVKPGAYQLPSVSYVTLDGKNRMQCTTCHDPHDDNRATVGWPFWRHKTAGSADFAYDQVCAACHVGSNFQYYNSTDHGTKDPASTP